MKVAPNEWHTMGVDFQASRSTVTLDGRKAIEWDDETFKDAGNVGVRDRLGGHCAGVCALKDMVR